MTNLPPLLLGLAGAALIAAGVTLLWRAWRRRIPNRAPSILGGWALIAGAMIPWSVLGGPDRGIILGIMVVCLIASAAIAVSAMRPVHRRRQRRASAGAELAERGPRSWRTPVRVAYVTFLAGPLAGAASLLLAVSLFTLLRRAGLNGANNGVIAFFVLVLVWMGLASWAAMDEKLWRKSAVVAAPAVLCALHLFVLVPGPSA